MVGLILKMGLQEHVDACGECFVVRFAVAVVYVVVDVEGGLVAVEGYLFDVRLQWVLLGVELQQSYFVGFCELEYDIP